MTPQRDFVNVGATGRRAVLLPFKHEDVRLSSAYSVDGHRQGFAIGRKLDFLGVRDLAVELAGQFQCVLVQSALVHPSRRRRQAGKQGRELF